MKVGAALLRAVEAALPSSPTAAMQLRAVKARFPSYHENTICRALKTLLAAKRIAFTGLAPHRRYWRPGAAPPHEGGNPGPADIDIAIHRVLLDAARPVRSDAGRFAAAIGNRRFADVPAETLQAERLAPPPLLSSAELTRRYFGDPTPRARAGACPSAPPGLTSRS